MKLIEHRYADRRLHLGLHDGARLVAQARAVGSGGYVVRAYGVCLLEKDGGPLARNVAGTTDPERAYCPTARAARRLLRRLGTIAPYGAPD